MSQPLRLYIPGSIAPVTMAIEQAVAALIPPIDVSFDRIAPSGKLAEEIAAGAPAGVMISADAGYLDQLRHAGIVSRPRPLAGNALCLIVRPGWETSGLPDLSRAGVRVAVFQHQDDPCGQYTRQMIARAGIAASFAEKVQRGEVIIAPGGQVLPDAVVSGAADLGVLYASWASSFADRLTIVELPEPFTMSDRILFTIGVVDAPARGTVHPDAERFVAFMLGEQGQAILRAARFLPAPAQAFRPGD